MGRESESPKGQLTIAPDKLAGRLNLAHRCPVTSYGRNCTRFNPPRQITLTDETTTIKRELLGSRREPKDRPKCLSSSGPCLEQRPERRDFAASRAGPYLHLRKTFTVFDTRVNSDQR